MSRSLAQRVEIALRLCHEGSEALLHIAWRQRCDPPFHLGENWSLSASPERFDQCETEIPRRHIGRDPYSGRQPENERMTKNLVGQIQRPAALQQLGDAVAQLLAALIDHRRPGFLNPGCDHAEQQIGKDQSYDDIKNGAERHRVSSQ